MGSSIPFFQLEQSLEQSPHIPTVKYHLDIHVEGILLNLELSLPLPSIYICQ